MPAMAQSPFKEPKFLALFHQWNQVLKETGFKDAEDFSLPDPPLKDWHGTNWNKTNPDKIEETQRYYELASGLLLRFRFKNRIHKRIWQLHCDGKSRREIAKLLNQKKCSRTNINAIVLFIQRKSGLRNDG